MRTDLEMEDGARRTRRTALRAGAAAASAGVLAACQVPGQTAVPRMDERDVTLTYLTDWANNAVRNEWVKQALPRFTAEFPRIKVQVEAAGNDSAQAILTASARELNGRFLIDEDVLRDRGKRDFARYAVYPALEPLTDLFLD